MSGRGTCGSPDRPPCRPRPRRCARALSPATSSLLSSSGATVVEGLAKNVRRRRRTQPTSDWAISGLAISDWMETAGLGGEHRPVGVELHRDRGRSRAARRRARCGRRSRCRRAPRRRGRAGSAATSSRKRSLTRQVAPDERADDGVRLAERRAAADQPLGEVGRRASSRRRPPPASAPVRTSPWRSCPPARSTASVTWSTESNSGSLSSWRSRL